MVSESGRTFGTWNFEVNLEMYCRMVRTKQQARTDPTPRRERGSSLHYDSRTEGDSVADTASHVPAVLVQSERGESTGGQENATSRRADVPPA